jgi:hypothetical protein
VLLVDEDEGEVDAAAATVLVAATVVVFALFVAWLERLETAETIF